ncbi:uncharacterized protein LOC106668523 isoform X2 [Cimex lectularius]|uniref:Uncharacterized protein n=1 Tax=Cimex lectularius TaxID=79782 RepID=A0A8I6RZ94_CIMLE|nr:uncharacterized protein LOC106668523 isoform X2 [Cimex lectularius]
MDNDQDMLVKSVSGAILCRKMRTHLRITLTISFTIFFLLYKINKNQKRQLFDACPDKSLMTFQEESLARIPDLIHFYRNYTEAGKISKSELICIKAALHKHNRVYIHSENPLATGEVLRRANFSQDSLTIRLASKSIQLPIVVDILWNYGGIFLQNDVYLIQRLDDLRFHSQVKTTDGSIIAANKYDIRTGWFLDSRWYKVDGVVLERDWGALYLKEVLRTCTVKAVKLSDGQRLSRLSWIRIVN